MGGFKGKDYSKLSKAAVKCWERRRQLPWRPSRRQRRALEFVAVDLRLAGDNHALAHELGCMPITVHRWRKDPNFLGWWNSEVLRLAQLHSGQALGRLMKIATDPSNSAATAIRAIDKFLSYVGVDKTPTAENTMLEVLEKLKGKRLRVGIEVDDRPDTTQQPGQDDEQIKPVEATQRNDYYQNPKTGRSSLLNPPQGAMAMSPLTLEAAARRVLAEAEGEGGQESPAAAVRPKGPRTYDLSQPGRPAGMSLSSVSSSVPLVTDPAVDVDSDDGEDGSISDDADDQEDSVTGDDFHDRPWELADVDVVEDEEGDPQAEDDRGDYSISRLNARIRTD